MDYFKKKESVNIEVGILFDLINQIDKYSQFLPWCSNSRILSDIDDVMIGEISVSKKFINWKFSTKNKYIRNKKISFTLVEGPFSHLEGYWNFLEINDYTTLVELFLEYKFSNRMIEISLKPVFLSIMSSILDSFISEAFKIKNER